MKGREKLQFQRVFLEIFGLLNPRSCGKCAFFFAVIEQINIRCTFINTVSCDEQHGLYRIVLTHLSDDLEAFCKVGCFLNLHSRCH